MNLLFITLDQFRADALSLAGNTVVSTPTLDGIAREGIHLRQHYSQAAPCAPGRAALYTGTYQMNNRVVFNGTPLDERFDNIAKVARRAGYVPYLFGYTDQGVDPTHVNSPRDPRLDGYDGILPGFEIGLYLPESQAPWVDFMRAHGFDVPYGWMEALRGEPDRPAEYSLTTFLTNSFLEWLPRQESGWCAHLSYLRPHPPYAAAGEYATRIDPASVPLPIEHVGEPFHYLHEIALGSPYSSAPTTEEEIRHLRSQYYGSIDEVDDQLARVVEAIKARGEWEETLVIVTSDHGDQLGDHGLIEKLGYFPQSYHILGIWRDPRRSDAGRAVDHFTENVDILPSLCVALDVAPPRQCDGRVLQTLFDDVTTPWRHNVHYEWDFRFLFLSATTPRWPFDRSLSDKSLSVAVSDEIAFVQFGDGTYLGFDLARDPTWRTLCTDDDRLFAQARDMLTWRMQHTGRDYTDMLLGPDRVGIWPAALADV